MPGLSPFVILTGGCYVASVVLFYRKNYSFALLALLLASFLLRIEMALLDPFLHNWDERFHALVAKNMVDRPFTPMLIRYPALPYDYTAWCCNQIWVHKQPLFLWQMAASMKLFGVNEFALRLPSVIMGTLMVFFTYRIGKKVSGRYETAFLSALFFSLSWYQLELTSGLISLDHNDISFSFYILASFWAFAEYLEKRTLKWVLLTGLFAGAAILCKWMVGLLVYAAWGISVLLYERKNFREYRNMFYALLVTAAVVLPWQLYIMNAFPKEAAWEYAYNTKHLFEVLEGHEHEWSFYFTLMPVHYGVLFLPFLLLGMCLLAGRIKTDPLALSIVAAFSIVYIFFTAVPTRLQSFTFIAAPFAYIFIAYGLTFVKKLIGAKNKIAEGVVVLLILFLAVYSMRIQSIRDERSWTNLSRNHKVYLTGIYKSIPDPIQGKKTVVFNTHELGNLELMFYRNVTAYDFFPGAETLDSLHSEGFRLYALPNPDGSELPDLVKERDFIQILPGGISK
jgi:4-amino-4-deoxy-L-arabinose transferase-like glycosyltransferase